MLVSWPFALRDMQSAGGDGGSDGSSHAGGPPVAWECRRSLASSWHWSWCLSEAAAGQAGQPHVASGRVWLVRGSDAGQGGRSGRMPEDFGAPSWAHRGRQGVRGGARRERGRPGTSPQSSGPSFLGPCAAPGQHAPPGRGLGRCNHSRGGCAPPPPHADPEGRCPQTRGRPAGVAPAGARGSHAQTRLSWVTRKNPAVLTARRACMGGGRGAMQ